MTAIGFRETPAPDPTTDVLVEIVVSAAAAELHIPRPAIQYFDERYVPGLTTIAFYYNAAELRQGQKLLGRCSPGGGTVYLHVNLSQQVAMTTAAHEVFHAFARHHEDLFAGTADEEAAAESYAQRFMTHFHRRSR
jgi:hypothetical protein